MMKNKHLSIVVAATVLLQYSEAYSKCDFLLDY